MLIFVDMAICSKVTPRFLRMVANPRMLVSSFISLPFPPAAGGVLYNIASKLLIR